MHGPNPQDEQYIDIHEPNWLEVLDDTESVRDGTRGWYPTDADSDTVIWRYMDLGKFLSLVQNSQLWLSHRSTFKDPYEGRYSKPIAEEIQQERWGIDEPNDEDSAYFSDQNTEDYVSCWNMKQSQSAALWDVYTEGDNGVAIKSTVGALKEAIDWFPESKVAYQLQFGKVTYHTTGEEPRGHYAPIFTKRDIFDFENEYRIVLTSFDSLDDVEIDGVKIIPEVGIGVKIDPSILIDEVYISPSAGGYLRDVVERLKCDYGPDYSIKKSTLYDHPLVDS